MRLVAHYLSQIFEKTGGTGGTGGPTFPNITLGICTKAYTNKIFGDYTVITKSNPITINQPPPSTPVSSSWPSSYGILRCEKCHRITENIWGPWRVCIDCHLKRICSECGQPAVIIGVDNYPKCCEHQL